jgi:hypothetical protein
MYTKLENSVYDLTFYHHLMESLKDITSYHFLLINKEEVVLKCIVSLCFCIFEMYLYLQVNAEMNTCEYSDTY